MFEDRGTKPLPGPYQKVYRLGAEPVRVSLLRKRHLSRKVGELSGHFARRLTPTSPFLPRHSLRPGGSSLVGNKGRSRGRLPAAPTTPRRKRRGSIRALRRRLHAYMRSLRAVGLHRLACPGVWPVRSMCPLRDVNCWTHSRRHA